MIRTNPALAAASGTALARAPPIRSQADAIEDWDCLFRAVLARLRLAQSSAPDIQTTVLECLDALDKLHGMLVHERRQAMASTTRALVIERFVKPPKLRERVRPWGESTAPAERVMDWPSP